MRWIGDIINPKSKINSNKKVMIKGYKGFQDDLDDSTTELRNKLIKQDKMLAAKMKNEQAKDKNDAVKNEITDRDLIEKERELIKDLEALMTLSPKDAKQLIQELELNNYSQYLEKLMQDPAGKKADESELKVFGFEDESYYTVSNDHSNGENKDPDSSMAFKDELSQFELSEFEDSLLVGTEYDMITWKTLHQKGLDSLRAGKFDNSIFYFEKGLTLEPNSYSLWASKGVSLFWLNRPKEAVECLNRSLKINPNYYKAWFYKGLVHKTTRHYKIALRCFSNAVRFNQRFANGWFEKGQLFQLMGNYNLALESYDKALEIEPKNPGVKYHRDLCMKILRKSKKFLFTNLT
jgi:tetratricopeptide (TPR) repeat protein